MESTKKYPVKHKARLRIFLGSTGKVLGKHWEITGIVPGKYQECNVKVPGKAP